MSETCKTLSKTSDFLTRLSLFTHQFFKIYWITQFCDHFLNWERNFDLRRSQYFRLRLPHSPFPGILTRFPIPHSLVFQKLLNKKIKLLRAKSSSFSTSQVNFSSQFQFEINFVCRNLSFFWNYFVKISEDKAKFEEKGCSKVVLCNKGTKSSEKASNVVREVADPSATALTLQ